MSRNQTKKNKLSPKWAERKIKKSSGNKDQRKNKRNGPRKTVRKINKTICWFPEKINKTDNLEIDLTKKKREKISNK